MKKLITKIATNPNLQFLPAIQKASKLFDKINNDFENSTKNYNETVSKFYNYTSVFPTSFMAKKLKIVCILPMFISEKK